MVAGLNRFHLIALFSWQCMNFFAVSNIFSIFSNFMPEWRCGAGPIGTNCTHYKLCHASSTSVTFTHVSFHSTAFEYGWFCDDASYAKYSNTVQFIGYFVGTLLMGCASDFLGRKPVTLFSLALGLVATVCSGIAHSVPLIFAARFCIGLAIGGQMVVGCTYVMEMLLPEQRMFSRAYFNWGISRMLLTAICYFTQEWRAATIGIALVASPALLAFLFVFPESPTWLHSKGRLDEMRESERKIARIAGIPYVPVTHPAPVPPKSLLTLLRSGMWVRLLVLWFMWFTAATSSYATDLASSRLSGDLYLNQFLFGLVLYVSKVILGIVDARCPAFSRRVLHQGSQAGAVLCFGVMAALKWQGYRGPLMLVLNLAGIVFVEYTWDACYLCAIEGSDTSARASVTGSSSFVARFGMILSPTLSQWDLQAPGVVYLVVFVLGSANLVSSYFSLVETKGVKLDEVHMGEGNNGRRNEEMRAMKP